MHVIPAYAIAYEFLRERERALAEVADRLKLNAAAPEQIAKRLDALVAEKRALERSSKTRFAAVGARGTS